MNQMIVCNVRELSASAAFTALHNEFPAPILLIEIHSQCSYSAVSGSKNPLHTT